MLYSAYHTLLASYQSYWFRWWSNENLPRQLVILPHPAILSKIAIKWLSLKHCLPTLFIYILVFWSTVWPITATGEEKFNDREYIRWAWSADIYSKVRVTTKWNRLSAVQKRLLYCSLKPHFRLLKLNASCLNFLSKFFRKLEISHPPWSFSSQHFSHTWKAQHASVKHK